MDVELVEIRDFLAEYAPFSLLDAAALNALPRRLAVRYLRRGSAFPPVNENQRCLYAVRQGAIELRTDDGRLTGMLSEGDIFDQDCCAAAEHAIATERSVGTAIEDTLLYLLPCETLQALRRENPALDDYFVRSVAERLRHGRHALGNGPSERTSLMTLTVSDFVRRAPVGAESSLPICEAARIMSREGVSALLIVDSGALCGIVTDRDLRTRCLAQHLAPNEPLARIMSTEVACIGPESAAFEALMLMTRKGIHHLPVVDASGIHGLVSATDLLRWQSTDTVFLVGLIGKSPDVESLMRASAELPELQLQMQGHGATPGQVGQAVASVNDAITCRLIELALQELGPAPVAFTWLACGSQGRHEQTVHSDQDNALILDDAFDDALHGHYFSALAERVNDGLDACGYRYCPGKVMASNPLWRQPQRAWIAIFRGWIGHTDAKAAMLAANFLDLRTVYGDTALLMPLHEAIKQAYSKSEVFLANMVANALKNKPPLGFFRNFTLIADGEHADSFDIKRGGLIPVTDIARILALSNGQARIGTLARLREAAGTPVLSAESAHELEEAFEYFGNLRLQHQAEQIRRGQAPDNYLSPAALTSLERSNLKEAFAVVERMQKILSQRYPDRPA
ncbi:putative nucleotidyltransferase substrate binding domain-containing protein [Propionivibrio sp.]|uniref:putative nucleotidyltransferase substrate binding domain-containing protein n=1 Tax=Propionivibrio sp. TaxID=2212460 RepID=UPI0025D9245B|nr:putative nucleotidyltransferase substrate binding domain-containing protein [Propionivibrio sp.]MBK8745193.1 cyclic nucleotide-binding/CBS domain-containing protein [Propionivibrio sp.]MBK8892497.1 cyclic nucleotide-binding/CBS domain-containing protein [Propionivibrio sp.]